MATMTIKLTSAGADTDNVNIYTDSDSYNTPIGSTTTGVLTGPFGFTVGVPSGATTVRIQNVGTCTNYVDVTIT
jgi:hypothetical protein